MESRNRILIPPPTEPVALGRALSIQARNVKIVVAHHPYEAQREDEISFAKDEVIKVTDFSDPDWWVGKKKDGSLGFFPSNFVSEKDETSNEPKEAQVADKENIPPQPVAADTTVAPQEEEKEEAAPVEDEPPVEEKKDKVIGMARVMEDYAMQESGELTLHRGGIVNVYEVLDDEWSRGELNGKVGKYPHKYVEDIDMPGRPDLGQQSAPAASSESTEEDAAPKGGFKLAAFGVKQGGIGSLLAGGFPGLKKAGAPKASPPPAATAAAPPPAVPPPAVPEPVEEPKPVQHEATEPIKAEPTTAAEETSNQKSLGKAIVLHPYDAESEDELSLLRGEYVEILDRNADEGWWKGLNERGQSGIFPNNFVREIDEESIAAPPTPTRARRSVQSVNSTSSSITSPTTAPAVPGNRPTSVNNTPLAKPPQVPRPASVQTPATARPISVQPPAQRPSSISHTNSSSLATPPKVAAAVVPQQQVTSPTIEEEEAREMEEEDAIMSPAESDEKVQSPIEQQPTPVERSIPQPPAPVERKPSLASQDSIDAQTFEQEIPRSIKEEAIKSPPVIPEDPITDVEEKESGAEDNASPAITTAAPVAAAAAPVVAATRDIVEEEKEEPKEVVAEKEEEPVVPQESPIVEEEKKEEAPKPEEEETIKSDEEAKKPEEEEAVDKEDEFKDAKEEEDKTEEEKNELDIISSGPKLTTPSRARIGGRARRSPSSNTTAQEPSQNELLQKQVLEEEEEEKPKVEEEAEETKKESPTPPAKPVKPIFAKFPTPFAGAGISKSHLKPTQTRKLWDDKPEEKAPTVDDDAPPKPSGVKNIASRFNFAGITSSGSNDVLETKLKNHTKNEVEKVRKEFELLLNEEREKRVALESLVQELLEKVKSFEQ